MLAPRVLTSSMTVLLCSVADAQSAQTQQPETASPTQTSEPPAPTEPEEPDLLHDPEDGAFDVSQWLSSRTGFFPLVMPITEPAAVWNPMSSSSRCRSLATPKSSSFTSSAPSEVGTMNTLSAVHSAT